MNGGAHGRETKEVLVEARAVDRQGNTHVLPVAELHYPYRHCGAPEDFIFTEALFQGEPGDPAAILAEMDGIAAYREEAQPIKSRTGGSTFKNPPGKKAWQLIDAAGCRGLSVGDAKVSEMHCNFLINEGNATGADIETLGETVRARVKADERGRARMGDQAPRRARLAKLILRDGRVPRPPQDEGSSCEERTKGASRTMRPASNPAEECPFPFHGWLVRYFAGYRLSPV